MNRQVFRYRTATLGVLAVFLTVWSLGWLVGWAASFASGTVNVNRRNVPVSEALPLIFGMLLVGLVVASLAVGVILYLANARLEIESGWISAYDLFGRRYVRGSLSTCKLSSGSQPWNPNATYTRISTEGGDIKVFKSIQGYGRLLGLLDGTLAKPVQVSFVPTRKSFAYRWGAAHLFSFVWLLMVAAFVGFMGLTMSSSQSDSPLLTATLMLVVLLIFGSGGVYLQLQGWNEKVLLQNGMLVWIDCLGKTKVQAPFGSVLDESFTAGNRGGASLRVITQEGDIVVTSNLKGFAEFRANISQLLTEIRERRSHTTV